MTADSASLDRRYQPDARAVGGLLSLDALDRRTRPFKRYETIRGAVLADMGGEENVSEVQKQLVSKFATIALQLEIMEAAAIDGNEIDVDLFGRAAGHLRRIAEALGMQRVARDVTTSTLEEIADEIAAEEAERAAAAE